jgi:hypothetical protein
MEIDKNYEKLASHLTWRPWTPEAEIELHAGMLIKSATGEIYLIGDLLTGANDGGCLCCNDWVEPVEYADIYELIEKS